MIKNEVIIGIDFSLNSVGITLYDGASYESLSFLNWRCISKMEKFDLESFVGKSKMIFPYIDKLVIYDRPTNNIAKFKDPSAKINELNRWHRTQLASVRALADLIFDRLKEEIGDRTPKFVIENYLTSLRGGGDNTVQLIEGTLALKDRLAQEWGEANIFLTTAPQIKMMAGKGNYTKQEMLDAFRLEKTGKINTFHKGCFLYGHELKKGSKDLVKPVDDLIDSYYAVKWWFKYFGN